MMTTNPMTRRGWLAGMMASGLAGCASSRAVELSDGSQVSAEGGIRVRFLGTGAAGWEAKWLKKNPHARRQSSVLLEDKVLIDFTQCGFDLLPKDCHPEALFITHSHGDHYNPKAIAKVGVKRVYAQESWADAARAEIGKAADKLGLPAPEVLALPFGRPVTVCGLRITGVPSNHSTTRMTEGVLERTSMYLVEKGPSRLLYATDTSGIPDDAARMIGMDPIITEQYITRGRYVGNPMMHKPQPITALVMEATCGNDDTSHILFAHSSVQAVKRIVDMLIKAKRYVPPAGQHAYVTHLGVRYRGWPAEKIDKELPETLRAAHDGLEVVFSGLALFATLFASVAFGAPVYDQSQYQFSLPAVLERSVPRAADADRGWIQKAIDEKSAQGGGRVVVPAGVHNTGTIWLRSGVELHLAKGAILNASTRQEDYDQFPKKDCPITPEFSDKALICAANAEDIAITGEGVVDGNGPAFYDTTKFVRGKLPFWRVPDHPRPRLVQFANCRRIRLCGVTFRDAAAFTMYFRGCEDLSIGHVAVVGDRRITNNDGIDIDGCRRVRIGDSVFNTGDDCFALRAIRTRTDPERAVVCEDVVVSNCTLSSACQAIRIGCPSDDTIRNVVFRNIDMSGSNNGIYFGNHLYCVREVDEGFLDATDLLFENFRGTLTGSPMQILVDDGIRLRRIDRVTFRDMDVRGKAPRHKTTIHAPFGSVRYENVTVNGKRLPDGQVPVSKVSDAPFVRKPSLTWDNLN